MERFFRLVAAAAAWCGSVTAYAEAPEETFGEPGHVHVGGFGSVSFGDSDGELYLLHGHVEWFVAQDLSLAFQPFAGYVNGETDDVGLIGLDVMLKWYVFDFGPIRPFIEGGGGTQHAMPASFPDGGSHFNFRPQVGIGAAIHADDRVDILTGIRYLHISNAGIVSPNEGYDSVMIYLGATFRF